MLVATACVVALLHGARRHWRELGVGGDVAQYARQRIGLPAAARRRLAGRSVRRGRALSRRGLLLGLDHRGGVRIPMGGFSGVHTLVVGATGSGKTVTQAWIAAHAITAGHAAIVIDPKGDDALRNAVKATAELCGARFLEWTPEGPCVYNPYARGSDTELADKLLAGEDVDRAALPAPGAALPALGRRSRPRRRPAARPRDDRQALRGRRPRAALAPHERPRPQPAEVPRRAQPGRGQAARGRARPARDPRRVRPRPVDHPAPRRARARPRRRDRDRQRRLLPARLRPLAPGGPDARRRPRRRPDRPHRRTPTRSPPDLRRARRVRRARRRPGRAAVPARALRRPVAAARRPGDHQPRRHPRRAAQRRHRATPPP